MTTGARSQCDACVHLQLRLGFHVPQICSAFPTGIPDARLDNERDHRQPDDGGVQFIAKPGDAFPAYAFPVSGVPVERP